MTENCLYHKGPKERKFKDFSFLMQKQEIIISKTTAKYILQQGQRQQIGKIQQPIDIYYTYKQYDYKGNQLMKILSPMKFTAASDRLRDAIMSMKLMQVSWFNVCDQPIHSLDEQNQIDNDQHQHQFVAYTQRTGSHYEIKIARIQYRNYQTINAKRQINEQERRKGIQFFKKQQFFNAAKTFKYLACISDASSLPNGTFNKDQLVELKQIYYKARRNYLVCFFKISQCQQDEFHNFTQTMITRYLTQKPRDHYSEYFNAKWLLKNNLYDDALDAAEKSNQISSQKGTNELIRTIKIQKANRGKIKVLVSQVKQQNQ